MSLFIKSGSRYRAATASEVCEQASAYVFAQVGKDRPILTTPRAAQDFMRHQGGLDHEQFGVIYLDNRHRALKVEVLFHGTLDGASVHPRVVVKACLVENAAAVILFHNHPSGIADPSASDEVITKRLKDALALIDVRVVDHIILAAQDCVSLAERGRL